MPIYKFRAIDTNNNVIENQITASSKEEARIVLGEKGYIPYRIEPLTRLSNISISFTNKVRRQDIIIFCRELAIIIKSGVNLTLGLDILKKQSPKELKKTVNEINMEVQKGRTLAQAMKETELKFPELLIKMVSTGELSGNLDNILDNMADYYEQEDYVANKIKSAMIYPIVLIIVAIGLLVFFSKYILPQMVELLAGQQLPLITRFTIGAINILGSLYGLLGLVGIIGIIILIKYLLSDKQYRRIRDNFMIGIPVIGSISKDIITVRFTRTLYLLMKSGLDIVNILDILKRVISNSVAEEVIDISLDGVKRGEKLGKMLQTTKFFDPLVIQMINVGEETGELENILHEITIFYQKRLDTQIEKLVALVEPVFTLIIGGGIAFVIVSIALPIFGMAGDLSNPTSGFGVE